ncbi:MAG: hypothetical protein ACUVTY_13475 [Armatimonadota bacterium]
MDDLDEDLARVEERIAREEAEARVHGDLADSDLKRWYKELEAEAERTLNELQSRLSAQDENAATRSTAPQKLERFENLEIPTDADDQTASK